MGRTRYDNKQGDWLCFLSAKTYRGSLVAMNIILHVRWLVWVAVQSHWQLLSCFSYMSQVISNIYSMCEIAVEAQILNILPE